MSDVTASVIIAVHNGSDVLPQQLESLSRQVSAPRFEVLIMDNFSTDGLAECVSPFEDRLEIRIIPAHSGRGQASARNEGASTAAGQFLLFCDQDDEVSPKWVRTLCEALGQADVLATGPLEVRRFNSDCVRILFAGSDADEVTPYVIAGYKKFAYGCNLGVRKQTFIKLRDLTTPTKGAARIRISAGGLRKPESSWIIDRKRQFRTAYGVTLSGCFINRLGTRAQVIC